jgi:hypothetical protein
MSSSAAASSAAAGAKRNAFEDLMKNASVKSSTSSQGGTNKKFRHGNKRMGLPPPKEVAEALFPQPFKKSKETIRQKDGTSRDRFIYEADW